MRKYAFLEFSKRNLIRWHFFVGNSCNTVLLVENEKKNVSLRENCPYSEFPCPYFPAFGLNTERYSVSLRIQSECGKIQTSKTPNTGTFETVCIIVTISLKRTCCKFFAYSLFYLFYTTYLLFNILITCFLFLY